jgi:hypothetical protein
MTPRYFWPSAGSRRVGTGDPHEGTRKTARSPGAVVFDQETVGKNQRGCRVEATALDL